MKVVGIVGRLRHECSLPPRQDKRGCGCSKSYDHDRVFHVEEDKKDLVKNVHRLAHLGVILEDYPNDGFIVHHNSELSLIVEMQSSQHLDQSLMELKESVLCKLNESFSLGGWCFEISREFICAQC